MLCCSDVGGLGTVGPIGRTQSRQGAVLGGCAARRVPTAGSPFYPSASLTVSSSDGATYIYIYSLLFHWPMCLLTHCVLRRAPAQDAIMHELHLGLGGLPGAPLGPHWALVAPPWVGPIPRCNYVCLASWVGELLWGPLGSPRAMKVQAIYVPHDRLFVASLPIGSVRFGSLR